jgi:hypothetical protein
MAVIESHQSQMPGQKFNLGVVQEVYQESEAGLFQKFKQLPGDRWLSTMGGIKNYAGPA